MSGETLGRRSMMKKSLLASAAAAAALTLEERILLAATEGKGAKAPKKAATGKMPMGKIGKLTISRLICGGNLIGGWAHSRDLVYVSSLMKHYFTDEKILETLQICEENGINTIVTVVDKRTFELLARHWKSGGKIQWLAQLRATVDDPLVEAKIAVDNGAIGAHLVGNAADKWLPGAKGVDALKKIVAYLKENKLVAGCSAHNLETPVTCKAENVDLDYHFKTINTVKYWCDDPDKVAEFMKDEDTPWIGFKVLGAGVVNPTIGFKYALKSGADFLCVGMFDFQVSDDAKILKGLFARGIKRRRPWPA